MTKKRLYDFLNLINNPLSEKVKNINIDSNYDDLVIIFNMLLKNKSNIVESDSSQFILDKLSKKFGKSIVVKH